MSILKAYFKKYLYHSSTVKAALGRYVVSTIGGDWGKESLSGNYNKKVYCIRGADIPSMEIGGIGAAPTRYVLEKNYAKRRLLPNDIVIEISGGSPTQSTGRTAFITEKILNDHKKSLLCTNFCRIIRTKNAEDAAFVYMTLKILYDENIFFNWENGTTGIKNLALNDILNNLLITRPERAQQMQFSKIFFASMAEISRNTSENLRLSTLRDTLLPELMNGKIDLSKVEI